MTNRERIIIVELRLEAETVDDAIAEVAARLYSQAIQPRERRIEDQRKLVINSIQGRL